MQSDRELIVENSSISSAKIKILLLLRWLTPLTKITKIRENKLPSWGTSEDAARIVDLTPWI